MLHSTNIALQEQTVHISLSVNVLSRMVTKVVLLAVLPVADMLCESRLWRLALCPDQDNTDPQDLSFLVPQDQIIRTGSQSSAAPLLSTPPSPDQLRRRGYSTLPQEPQSLSLSEGDVIQPHPPQVPPYQALPPQQRPQPGTPISPGMEIPGQAFSPAPAPFLVPSSCQSICQNYSDLHIGGDQVLPIFTPDGALLPCSENRADRPFIQIGRAHV